MILLAAFPGCGQHPVVPDVPGQQRTIPAVNDPFEALWVQGGRQTTGTALSEEDALGHQFVVAGYAMNTEHGAVIQRITNIVRCDTVISWPDNIRGTWIVAFGTLRPAECTPTSGIGLDHECFGYLLQDCHFEQRVRAEDVALADRARLNGPWGEDPAKVSVAKQNQVTGSLERWRNSWLIRWERGVMELRSCTFDPGGASLLGNSVIADGIIQYFPPRVPEGTTASEMLGTVTGKIVLEKCHVRGAH